MAKQGGAFFCSSCGNEFPRWSGQCPSCEAWNTLTATPTVAEDKTPKKHQIRNHKTEKPTPITEIDPQKEARIPTGLGELDRVLGGGIVPGAVVLVSGEPGIGKSTLLLQIAALLAKKLPVLYVSGEESAQQIRLRAERLGVLDKKLILYPETDLLEIERSIAKVQPGFLVIDSIQTIYHPEINAAPGSVSQVREGATYLVKIAKAIGLPVFIIGHVTKDGNIAGPRLLEHIVDTVLYFEGEKHRQFRVLRGQKNRFGSTNEIGIFEMKDRGLVEVTNPSEVFLSERPEATPGSVITAAIEGTRPLLVEVQALVSFTKMPYPVRKSTGVDPNRLAIILAVLEKQLGLKLSNYDVYLNVAGGVEVDEPAVDLAIALAVVSSYKNKPLNNKTAVIGEIGLGGEVRSVSQIDQRIKEGEKLGFNSLIIPAGPVRAGKAKILSVSSVSEAVKACWQ